MAKFVWNGPPTAIEIWSQEAQPQIVFSGFVDTGQIIAASLDESHRLVASWIAFKMIEEAQEAPVAKPRAKTETATVKPEEAAHG